MHPVVSVSPTICLTHDINVLEVLCSKRNFFGFFAHLGQSAFLWHHALNATNKPVSFDFFVSAGGFGWNPEEFSAT